MPSKTSAFSFSLFFLLLSVRGTEFCYKTSALPFVWRVKWIFTAWLKGTCSGIRGDWRWSLTQSDDLKWHGGLKVCCLAFSSSSEDMLSLLWCVLTTRKRGEPRVPFLPLSGAYWVAKTPAQVEVIITRMIDASTEQVRSVERRKLLLEEKLKFW